MKRFIFIITAAVLLASCGARETEFKQPPQAGTKQPAQTIQIAEINPENPLDLELGGGSDSDYLADPSFDTDEFLEDFDSVGSVSASSAVRSFCESETTYYFSFLGDKLYYYDKATGVSGPLCSKPECVHAEGDKNCDAAISYCAGLSYYGGKLWWLDNEFQNGQNHYFIYCADPDGRNRQKVRETGLEEYGFNKNGVVPTVVFHRGFMYAAFATAEMSDATLCFTVTVTQTPLSKRGETVEILSKTLVNVAAAEIKIIPWRNKLIIPAEIYTDRDDGELGLKLIEGIYEYDTKTAEMSLLSTVESNEAFICYGVSPTGELLAGRDNHRIYRFGENGEELIYEPEGGDGGISNSRLIFNDKNIIFFDGGNYIGTSGIDSTDSRVVVLDYDFNPVADFTFGLPEGVEPKGDEVYRADLRAAGDGEIMVSMQYFLFDEKTQSNPFNYTYYGFVPLTGGEPKIFMTEGSEE